MMSPLSRRRRAGDGGGRGSIDPPSRLTGGLDASISDASSAVSAAAPGSGALKKQIDLRRFEAGDGEIEVKIKLRETVQLDRQKFVVPARILGKLVVCKQVRALLWLAQMLEANRWNILEAK
jgi:hypothetical protein